MQRNTLSAFAVIICLFSSIAVAKEKLNLQAGYSSEVNALDVITIELMTEKDDIDKSFPFIIGASPGLHDPGVFKVIFSKDGKFIEAKVSRVIIHNRDAPTDRAQRFSLELAKRPEAQTTCQVSWSPGALSLDVPGNKIVTNTNGPLKVLGAPDLHNKYAHPFPDNELSLKQGNDFGAWTFKYYYNTAKVVLMDDDEPNRKLISTTQQFDLNFGVISEGSFQSAKKGQYFDKFEAELGGYWVDTIYRQEPMLSSWGIVEVGLASKLQADQEFDKIDETFGVNARFYLHNESFDNIHKFFRFYDGKRGTQGYHETCLPPIITLGYDYVTNLQEIDPTSKETGHNRLDGSFYWSLPLARNVENKGIPLLDQIRQVDFNIDLAGIYDIDESKFSPEVNLSVDLALSTSDKMPTISLSWVNGKTAPKFEHFDAFLAGFKMKL